MGCVKLERIHWNLFRTSRMYFWMWRELESLIPERNMTGAGTLKQSCPSRLRSEKMAATIQRQQLIRLAPVWQSDYVQSIVGTLNIILIMYYLWWDSCKPHLTVGRWKQGQASKSLSKQTLVWSRKVIILGEMWVPWTVWYIDECFTTMSMGQIPWGYRQ